MEKQFQNYFDLSNQGNLAYTIETPCYTYPTYQQFNLDLAYQENPFNYQNNNIHLKPNTCIPLSVEEKNSVSHLGVAAVSQIDTSISNRKRKQTPLNHDKLISHVSTNPPSSKIRKSNFESTFHAPVCDPIIPMENILPILPSFGDEPSLGVNYTPPVYTNPNYSPFSYAGGYEDHTIFPNFNPLSITNSNPATNCPTPISSPIQYATPNISTLTFSSSMHNQPVPNIPSDFTNSSLNMSHYPFSAPMPANPIKDIENYLQRIKFLPHRPPEELIKFYEQVVQEERKRLERIEKINLKVSKYSNF